MKNLGAFAKSAEMNEMSAKEPYENYKLPKSSKKGERFIDWLEVLKKKKFVKKAKIRRKKNE